jgi:hypothetical protein
MRLLGRVQRFLASPLARDPAQLVANERQLERDVAPPSLHLLLMLAHMPVFRREWAHVVDALALYLAQPSPAGAPVIPSARKGEVPSNFLLGDPLPSEDPADAEIGWTLSWLEIVARLGLLRPGTTWQGAFERLVDECDSEGIWHPRRFPPAARSASAFVWPSFPLESQLSGDARFTDVTFRLGLIGRAAGWQIDLA